MGLEITGRYRYPAPRPDWLALHAEDIIEPSRRIIDAHHHIWTEPGSRYLADDLWSDLSSGHNVIASVAVQAQYAYRPEGPEKFRCIGETEALESIRRQSRWCERGVYPCAAIVGFADLMLGEDVASVIEMHQNVAPTAFRGIRHGVGRDPHFPDGIVLRAAPAGMLADPEYRRGLGQIASFGLSYDAMLYHRQIPELTDVARALPGLRIVLDHIGCIIGVGPYEGRARESFDVWRAAMRDLALCPNVTVKLGGFGMIICGATWHQRPVPPASQELAQAWRPCVETCIELFGAERCMFESNFPVDKAMYSYRVLWNAFKRLTQGASEPEKDQLFRATAARTYRLDCESVA